MLTLVEDFAVAIVKVGLAQDKRNLSQGDFLGLDDGGGEVVDKPAQVEIAPADRFERIVVAASVRIDGGRQTRERRTAKRLRERGPRLRAPRDRPGRIVEV